MPQSTLFQNHIDTETTREEAYTHLNADIMNETDSMIEPKEDLEPSAEDLKPKNILKFSALQLDYSDINSLLLELYDSEFGIITEVNNADPNSATNRSIRRDATGVIDLMPESYLSPDHPLINSITLLQRTLGTTRGIDHVLQQLRIFENRKELHHLEKELKKIYKNLMWEIIRLQNELKTKTDQLTQSSIQKKLINLEKNYNTNLCLILHKARLDKGLQSSSAYQDILLHYRYLAATLDNAPMIETLTSFESFVHYDDEAKSFSLLEAAPDDDLSLDNTLTKRITIKETSFPITEKTTGQIGYLGESGLGCMATVFGSQSKFENYQAAQNVATQIANKAFFEKITNNKTSLPAQLRKKMPTIKNGFIVVNEFQCEDFVDNGDQRTVHKVATECYVASRTASLAYVGEGESDENIKLEVKKNLTQLQLAYSELKQINEEKAIVPMEALNKMDPGFNMVVANTDCMQENQNVIVKNTEAAVNEQSKNFRYTYAPVNWNGKLRAINEVDQNHQGLGFFDRLSSPFQPVFFAAKRISQVVASILRKSEKPNISCASGQDRTGTIFEALICEKIKKFCNETLKIINVPIQKIQNSRAKARIQSFMASVLVPGSPGMKSDSKPGNYFGEVINSVYYLKSANTNKSAPINNNLKKLLIAQNCEQTFTIMHQRASQIINHIDDFIARHLTGSSFYLAFIGSENYRVQIEALRDALKVAATAKHNEASQNINDGYDPNQFLTIIRDQTKQWNLDEIRNDKKCKALLDNLEEIITRDSENSIDHRRLSLNQS